MPNKKAQAAVELIIIMGFLIFFFIIFTGIIQSQIQEKSKEKKTIIIKDIVKTVQEEIDLATESTDGYKREFKIPDKIINDDYDISIFEGIVYAKTTDQKHAIAVNIKNITGNISKGTNTITKQNGIVYLN
ncbi:MAG: hypothetical protein V1889_01335 [archaeon]